MDEVQTQRGMVESSLPRVTIQYCTQCKWLLRAAYYAQELLSTFNTALGEVSLQPSTGGTFIVTIVTASKDASSSTPDVKTLWDRKTDGGFPETKELKRRVRDVIEPGRDLGHVDRDHGKEQKKEKKEKEEETTIVSRTGDEGKDKKQEEEVKEIGKEECEDCK